MEEQTSIIDLIFSNFRLEVVDGGLSLDVSWAFLFFAICAIFCYKWIKNRFKKNK